MNFRLLLVSLISTTLIIGCGANKTQEVALPDCEFPDALGVAAPTWVCGVPVAEYALTAVGSAQKSSAGFNFMKEQASATARVELAQQMTAHVSNMVKQYVETTGQGDFETVDQVRTSVSKVLTDQNIVGSRIVNTRTSPNGYLYVLLAVDESNLLMNTQQSLQTSMNSENALWQQFKAENGFTELAKEIANQ